MTQIIVLEQVLDFQATGRLAAALAASAAADAADVAGPDAAAPAAVDADARPPAFGDGAPAGGSAAIRLDASAVTHLGALAAQLILARHRAGGLHLDRPSQACLAGLRRLGLDPDTLA